MSKPQLYNNERDIKKVFSDVSSLEHKNVPVKEVELINFNHYKNATKYFIKEEMERISLINKVAKTLF